MPVRSPYETLGVKPTATDAEVRSAYRRLVQLHHPDHNAGSAESARRFEEVQEAYAQIQRLRKTKPRQSPPKADPDLENRMADLERQVRAAHEARERARREAEAARERARKAAREATAQHRPITDQHRPTTDQHRPTDEELGYYTTEDSFTKILSDAREELAGRFADTRGHPVVKRVSDLIDGLEELASKLDGREHRK